MIGTHRAGRRKKPRLEVVTALLLACLQNYAIADDENLSALATDTCQLPALEVSPPKPWYSVPIDSQEPGVTGCQMIWEEGEQYMGIMRLLAHETGNFSDPEIPWEMAIIGFEAVIMEQMGIIVIADEPLWSRDSVPISGDGFTNAKAVAFKARLEGMDLENEAHFLVFESADHKYVISVMTPSEATSPDVYTANTSAMGTVMRTLQPR